MSLTEKSMRGPNGSLIYFNGPDLNTKNIPAVIYFALSGYTSLFLDPFNQPVKRWNQHGIRVFSWDLPFHGQHDDPKLAMEKWAHFFIKGDPFIFQFLDRCQENLEWLIENEWVDPQQVAVAGLSRGGFIATHLAAREAKIKLILGFAPLTHPKPIEELKNKELPRIHELTLSSLVDQLTTREVRFYIGNRDIRVGTDVCYQFIRTLTEKAFDSGVRSPLIELVVYPSIGYKGHGTPPEIFLQGADWINEKMKFRTGS